MFKFVHLQPAVFSWLAWAKLIDLLASFLAYKAHETTLYVVCLKPIYQPVLIRQTAAGVDYESSLLLHIFMFPVQQRHLVAVVILTAVKEEVSFFLKPRQVVSCLNLTEFECVTAVRSVCFSQRSGFIWKFKIWCFGRNWRNNSAGSVKRMFLFSSGFCTIRR